MGQHDTKTIFTSIMIPTLGQIFILFAETLLTPKSPVPLNVHRRKEDSFQLPVEKKGILGVRGSTFPKDFCPEIRSKISSIFYNKRIHVADSLR